MAGMTTRGEEHQTIGKLIATNGRESEFTRIRIDAHAEMWSGFALLAPDAIIQPGLYTLLMNDGSAGDVFVDELFAEEIRGGGLVSFRGCGPVPDWANRHTSA